MGWSCAFQSCLPNCNVGPPAASHLYCNAGQVYNPGPLHTSMNTVDTRRVWKGLNDHVFTGQTHINAEDPHTCYLNQIPAPRALLPHRFVSQVSASRVKGRANRETGTSHNSPLLRGVRSTKRWPQRSPLEECGLNDHQGKDKYSRHH